MVAKKRERARPAEGATFVFKPRGAEEMEQPAARLDVLDLINTDPIRKSANYPGARSITGLVFTHLNDELLWRESNEEARAFHAADFDPSIIRLASQPFEYRYNDGSNRSHVPDCVALLRNGSIAVFDVRPRSRFSPEDQLAMEHFSAAMAELGITHEMWHEPSPARVHAIRRLKRVRMPDFANPDVVALASDLWEPGETIGSLERKLADRGIHRWWVPPAIDFLVWHHRFYVDLDQRYDSMTVLHGEPVE